MPMTNRAPAVIPLGQQHTQAIKTDADTSKAVLFSLTIPAGTLGTNDTLEIFRMFSHTSSAVTKTWTIEIGGVTVWTGSFTTTGGSIAPFVLSNRNSVSSQVSLSATNASASGFGNVAPSTSAINFAVDQTLTISAQWGTAGTGANSMTLESVRVLHHKAA